MNMNHCLYIKEVYICLYVRKCYTKYFLEDVAESWLEHFTHVQPPFSSVLCLNMH